MVMGLFWGEKSLTFVLVMAHEQRTRLSNQVHSMLFYDEWPTDLIICVVISTAAPISQANAAIVPLLCSILKLTEGGCNNFKFLQFSYQKVN